MNPIHKYHKTKPLKKVSSIHAAGSSALSRYFCHKKHKNRKEISSPVCVSCALCGRDYSLGLFRGLKTNLIEIRIDVTSESPPSVVQNIGD
jgi:hypothetical protein